MYRSVLAALAIAMATTAGSAQELPAGYPANYKETIAAAEKEGKVIVYSNTEQFAVQPVLEAFQKARAEAIPPKRFGTADEFGATCAFLCSTHAGYITGQNILMDGGIFPGAF